MDQDSNVISEDAKVWIYPASRKFYEQEVEGLEKKIQGFLKHWSQNDSPIESSYTLKYNRFIIIFTDPNASLDKEAIDKMVAFVLQLQKDYDLELLDKMNACFKQGPHVQYKSLLDFKKLIKDKAVNKNTLVFDNLISSKYEFDHFWEVPACESWYKNFFK